MRRFVTHNGVESRPRHRRLRSLAFLPTLITLGNLVCGFAAIHFAMRELYKAAPHEPTAFAKLLPSYLSVGALLVLGGMFLDAFDGLIARVTRSTTTFGGQLDSLADVITFGAAPATLMVAFMTRELAGDAIIPSPISDHPLGRLTWIAAAIYVAFTAIRLARFNVEHAKADFDHRVFRGLPSPGAAAIVVAIIFFQDQEIFPVARKVIVYATPAITAAIALLMVSRVPYMRFYRLLGRQPFHQVPIVLVVVALLFAWKAAATFLILTVGYGLSGPIQWLARRLRERTVPALAAPLASPSTQPRPSDKPHAL